MYKIFLRDVNTELHELQNFREGSEMLSQFYPIQVPIPLHEDPFSYYILIYGVPG
jgi:hypothetical protein